MKPNIVLSVLLFTGCSKDNGGWARDIGDGYVLFAIVKSNIHVRNMESTNGVSIPHEISEIGWNGEFIVAKVIGHGISNVWIVQKQSEHVWSNVDAFAFRKMVETNSSLAAISLKRVNEVK